MVWIQNIIAAARHQNGVRWDEKSTVWWDTRWWMFFCDISGHIHQLNSFWCSPFPSKKANLSIS